MLKNKTIYFPAMSAGTQEIAMKKNVRHFKNGKDFRFYNEDPLFDYPGFLISAGHQFKKKTKETWQYSFDKSLVLGDSGGYQIATGALEYKPEIVETIFNWLENNTNFAINLDLPPYVSANVKKAGQFEDHLTKSVENFKFFEKNQSGSTRYLNVLHGRKLAEVIRWYDNVKNFNFDGGWTIGSVSMNIFYILQSLFYLYENGEMHKYSGKKPLFHVLGFSRTNQLYTLFYFQQVLNKLDIDINITFDSVSPFLLAAFGHYVMYTRKEGTSCFDISNRIIRDNLDINLKPNLPCQCPVCKDVTFEELFSMNHGKGFTSEFYYMVMWHNLYHFIDYKENLENLFATHSREIVGSILSTDELAVMDIIDGCFASKEPTKYLQKHRYLLGSLLKDPEVSKKSLF